MKYYFITGGSRGIGKALINELLKKQDIRVWNYSRNLSLEHKNCTNVSTDFSSIEDLQNFKFPNLEDHEEIVLINNAGIIGEIAPIGQKDNQNIINTFNINTIAPSILTNQFVKQFQNINTTKLVLNISSGAGRRPMASWSEYCASKSALDMLSMVLAEEQKGKDFPINTASIAPGVINTQMQDKIRSVEPSKFSKLNYFIDLKENNQLDNPEFTAKKILKNLSKILTSQEVLLDLRQF